MIDPTKITNYDLNDTELQEHILFWVLVAGKTAKHIVKALDSLLHKLGSYKDNVLVKPPFEVLRTLTEYKLSLYLKREGIGCHSIKARAVYELVRSGLDLRTCSPEEMEKIFGIGMKTSRCFIIHTRKNAPYAGLDTHVLKYLKIKGYDVPKSTPVGKKYRELEKVFVLLAKKAGKSIPEFDLEIWNSYAKGY